MLVVDDESKVLRAFDRILKHHHYDADFFPNAASALRAVERNLGKYQVLLTDIRMPDMDGIAFAEKVRAAAPRLPIIFMTGYPSEEIKERVSQFRHVAFLEKPFAIKQTFDTLIPKLLREAEKAGS